MIFELRILVETSARKRPSKYEMVLDLIESEVRIAKAKS